MDFLLSIVVCGGVGLLIGWSGIAGFLLPIFFVGYLGLSVEQSLSISFFCFMLSGAIGAYNYWKKGQLAVKLGVFLSVGSLFGSLLGVLLSRNVPANVFTIILYGVVLFSGLSILFRKDKERENASIDTAKKPVLVALGFITAVICSLTGAGGPVLVMPLLVVLGVPIRTAVGVALFNSIFIAMPAFTGYISRSDMCEIWVLFGVCAVSHAVGIWVGSKTAHKINLKVLKPTVGVISIGIAIWKFLDMVF